MDLPTCCRRKGREERGKGKGREANASPIDTDSRLDELVGQGGKCSLIVRLTMNLNGKRTGKDK